MNIFVKKNNIMEKLENEIWKDIIGYEGLYQISNYGRVKSLEKILKHNYGGDRVVKERILKPYKDEEGYLRFTLSNNYNITRIFAHRLVGIHFIENKNNYPIINHINGIKYDNRKENLEWCTNSMNCLHSYRNLGLQNSNIYKIDKEVLELYNNGFSKRKIAKTLNCSRTPINRILKNK